MAPSRFIRLAQQGNESPSNMEAFLELPHTQHGPENDPGPSNMEEYISGLPTPRLIGALESLGDTDDPISGIIRDKIERVIQNRERMASAGSRFIRLAQKRPLMDNPFKGESQHAPGKSAYIGWDWTGTGINSDSPFIMGPGGLVPNIPAITGLNRGRMRERTRMEQMRKMDPKVTGWDRFQGFFDPGAYNRRTQREMGGKNITPQEPMRGGPASGQTTGGRCPYCGGEQQGWGNPDVADGHGMECPQCGAQNGGFCNIGPQRSPWKEMDEQKKMEMRRQLESGAQPRFIPSPYGDTTSVRAASSNPKFIRLAQAGLGAPGYILTQDQPTHDHPTPESMAAYRQNLYRSWKAIGDRESLESSRDRGANTDPSQIRIMNKLIKSMGDVDEAELRGYQFLSPRQREGLEQKSWRKMDPKVTWWDRLQGMIDPAAYNRRTKGDHRRDLESRLNPTTEATPGGTRMNIPKGIGLSSGISDDELQGTLTGDPSKLMRAYQTARANGQTGATPRMES